LAQACLVLDSVSNIFVRPQFPTGVETMDQQAKVTVPGPPPPQTFPMGSFQSSEQGRQGRRFSIAQHMDKLTDWAVAVSTIPFLFLMIPQIVTNFRTPAGLPELAWAGTASGGLGNLLLCSFFTEGGELKQAMIQAIGAFTNMFVVCQIYLYRPDGSSKPLINPIPFFTILVVMVVGLLLPALRACGLLHEVFGKWVTATTVIGLSSLFFSLSNQAVDVLKFDDDTLLVRGIATGIGLGLGILWVASGKSGPNTGGALATALFMFMPVPQVVENLVNPDALMQFNVGFVYFGVLGNGLGMSRALFTSNWVWFVGACWGCYTGGVVMAFTVVLANHRVSTPILTKPAEITLWIFVIIFILYTLLLVKVNRDAQKLKQRARDMLLASNCSSNGSQVAAQEPTNDVADRI